MIPSSELNWARQEQQEVAGHSPLLSSSWHTSEQPQQEDWPSEQGLAAAPLFHSFPYAPVSAAKPNAPAAVIQQQDWPEPPNNWENTMILAAHHPPHHHHHHPTNAGTQSTSHDHVQDPSLNIAITQAEPLMSSISRQYEALLSSGVNPSSSLSAAGAIAQTPQFGWSLMGAGRSGGHQQSLWMQEEDNTGSYNLTPYSSTTYNGGAAGVACDNNLSLYIDHHSNGSAATTNSNNTSADHAARLDLLGLGSLDQRRLQEIMVKREVPGTCDLINSRIGLNLGGRTYFSSADNHEDSFYGWMGKFGKRFRHGVGGLAAHPMTPVPNCQADGCNADLSMAKHYHRRHKVCAFHSKSPTVSIAGQTQRFCQQCSRFHSLPEFDDVKRSCRKRLADHNRRRRKPPQPPHPAGSTSSPAATGPAATSADGPARRTASDEDNISHDRHNNAGNQTSKEEEWPLSTIPLTSESLAISQEGNNANKIRQNDEDDNDEGSDSDEHNQLKSCGPSLSLTTTTIATSFNDVATHAHRQQTHVHDAYGGTMQWLRRGTSRENALMEVVASRSLHGLTDGGNMDKSLTLNTAFSEVSENHSSMNFSNLQGLKLPHNKSLFLGNNI